MGQKWVKNVLFQKMILDRLACNDPILGPLQAILLLPKSQNVLKMGCFATKNGSKMGQKWVKDVFFQNDKMTSWGAQTSELSPFWAHCKPFWPLQIHKMGQKPMMGQKRVKKVSFL